MFESVDIAIIVSCALGAFFFFTWIMLRGANRRVSPFRIYIAGTVTGNQKEGVVDQEYRRVIGGALAEVYPGIVIDDPHLGNENSIEYDDTKARRMFNICLNHAGVLADMVVAYIPEASMGTALEVYEAYKHGNFIVFITPLMDNWIVRLYGNRVYPTLDAFVDAVYHGDFNSIVFSSINDFDGTRTYNKRSF